MVLWWKVEAKDWRSGKPSSIPWKLAWEMAFNFSSRGSSGVPTETVAIETGIESKENREIGILGDLGTSHNVQRMCIKFWRALSSSCHR
jgi:hypothetical protein